MTSHQTKADRAETQSSRHGLGEGRVVDVADRKYELVVAGACQRHVRGIVPGHVERDVHVGRQVAVAGEKDEQIGQRQAV